MVFIEMQSSGRIVSQKYEPYVCDPSDVIIDEKMGHTLRLQVPHLRQPPEAIVHRYYESIRTTFTSRVTTFTDAIPWFTDSQRRYFNVDLFAKHLFQKVFDFEGIATGSIAARDFCLPFKDAQMSQIKDIMISAPITDKKPPSVVQTLDFDQIEAESESLGLLNMRDLQHEVPIYPSTQHLFRLTQRVVNSSDIETIFDSSAFDSSNFDSSAFDSSNFDSSNIPTPLLSSSRALWRSICESRHDVERLLVMTAAVKTAQQLMLSSIIVVDDIAEMHVVASVLRKTMKAYDVPVCAFFVGVIWSGDSTTSIDKTKQERIRQMQELRETLSARGIVVTLRRTPVLNTLVEALVYYKLQKNESPGNTFCYHEDVSKFNTSVALLKSVKRVIDFKKGLVVKKYPSVDSSVSIIDKKHRSKKELRKAARRKKRPAQRMTADTIDTTAVDCISTEWASWNYYQPSVLAECTLEPMDDQTLSELAYRDEEIQEDERRASRYRHSLEAQHQRLVGVNLPCCLGFILILDDKDDDDNDQDNPVDKSQGLKKHIDVLCGRLDTYQRMPKPHCTVMLTHAPPVIKNTGFA